MVLDRPAGLLVQCLAGRDMEPKTTLHSGKSEAQVTIIRDYVRVILLRLTNY